MAALRAMRLLLHMEMAGNGTDCIGYSVSYSVVTVGLMPYVSYVVFSTSPMVSNPIRCTTSHTNLRDEIFNIRTSKCVFLCVLWGSTLHSINARAYHTLGSAVVDAHIICTDKKTHTTHFPRMPSHVPLTCANLRFDQPSIAVQREIPQKLNKFVANGDGARRSVYVGMLSAYCHRLDASIRPSQRGWMPISIYAFSVVRSTSVRHLWGDVACMRCSAFYDRTVTHARCNRLI